MVPENNHPKWTGQHAVLVMVALFVLLWPAELISDFFGRILLQNIVMAALVVIIVRRTGASWADLGLHRQNLGRNIVTGFLGGLVISFLIMFLLALLVLLTGRVPEEQEVASRLAGIPANWRMLWPALVVVIAAPVAEELYFRGMIYPVLRARIGVDAAVLVSALFFSALHFSLFGLAPIAISGALLAYLYQRTGSLVTPIVAHSTWNAMTVLFTLLNW